ARKHLRWSEVDGLTGRRRDTGIDKVLQRLVKKANDRYYDLEQLGVFAGQADHCGNQSRRSGRVGQETVGQGSGQAAFGDVADDESLAPGGRSNVINKLAYPRVIVIGCYEDELAGLFARPFDCTYQYV